MSERIEGDAERRALEVEREGNAHLANGYVQAAKRCYRRAAAIRHAVAVSPTHPPEGEPTTADGVDPAQRKEQVQMTDLSTLIEQQADLVSEQQKAVPAGKVDVEQAKALSMLIDKYATLQHAGLMAAQAEAHKDPE